MEADTLPKLLLRNYKKYGDSRVAMRKKEFGIWTEYTWEEYCNQVKYFSLGLVSLGLKAGEKVAIIGDNDPQWYWAELAIQAAGAVPVGIFPDSIASEVKYIIDHSESTFIVAKDQEQVDKALLITDELPSLRKVIYWDPSGLLGYEETILISFDEVVEMGKEFSKTHPSLFEHNVEKIEESMTACLCYTSGTTGIPKGAVLTHRGMIATTRNWLAVDVWDSTFEYVSYMSPAWSAEQSNGITASLFTGMKVNFCEDPETVQENIREVAPQALLYSSRLWESLASTIRAKVSDAAAVKKFFYGLALPVGYKVADAELQGRRPNLLWMVLHLLCYWMVFRPLLDKHGLIRVRYCYTAGALLAPDTFRFFRALGLNLKQFYAITEAGGISVHRNENVKNDTVGTVLPRVELRISEIGEILVRGNLLASGYYKNVEETNKMFKGGWFYSGDGGYVTDEGQLVYWDRISEMMELADRAKFSPQYIEGSLRFSPYIKDAVAIGGKDKPYVTSLINIDFISVGQWAEVNRIPYTTFTDLSQKPAVIRLISRDVERVNKTLPESAKIKKYVLLHKELDPDDAELTRTRKLKREVINRRYQDLISAVYEDKTDFTTEASVVYRDGRKGKITTQVKINLTG